MYGGCDVSVSWSFLVPSFQASLPPHLAAKLEVFNTKYGSVLGPLFLQTAREKMRAFESWMKGPAFGLCMWLQPWLVPDSDR